MDNVMHTALLYKLTRGMDNGRALTVQRTCRCPLVAGVKTMTRLFLGSRIIFDMHKSGLF